MKNYTHLLFDLDNTLMDFDRAEKTAFYAAFSACGLTPNDEIYQKYHEINDMLWKQLERGEIERKRLLVYRYELLLKEIGEKDEDRSSRLSLSYFHELSGQRFLMPGALDVCRVLAGKYRMHIVTNGTYDVQCGRFYGSGLESYFETMFVSEKLGAAKPSEQFFARVFEALGQNDPSAYCVIGDSLSSDIAGASAVGIDAVWLDPSGKNDTRGLPVRHVLRDITQLPAYLCGGEEA